MVEGPTLVDLFEETYLPIAPALSVSGTRAPDLSPTKEALLAKVRRHFGTQVCAGRTFVCTACTRPLDAWPCALWQLVCRPKMGPEPGWLKVSDADGNPYYAHPPSGRSQWAEPIAVRSQLQNVGFWQGPCDCSLPCAPKFAAPWHHRLNRMDTYAAGGAHLRVRVLSRRTSCVAGERAAGNAKQCHICRPPAALGRGASREGFSSARGLVDTI